MSNAVLTTRAPAVDWESVAEVQAEKCRIALLRQTERFRLWREDLRAILRGKAELRPVLKNEVDLIAEQFGRAKSAAHDLASDTSGLIEAGRIDHEEKRELRLLLAEFEGFLVSFDQLLADYRLAVK